MLGYRGKYNFNPREWFNRDCLEILDFKNKKLETFLERATINRQEAYKEAKGIDNKICWRNKREFFKGQLLQMEEDFQTDITDQA